MNTKIEKCFFLNWNIENLDICSDQNFISLFVTVESDLSVKLALDFKILKNL